MADRGEGMWLPQVVIEFSEENYQKLSDLEAAEGLNKTTIVNRAVTMYFELLGMTLVGERILVKSPDGTLTEMRWR